MFAAKLFALVLVIICAKYGTVGLVKLYNPIGATSDYENCYIYRDNSHLKSFLKTNHSQYQTGDLCIKKGSTTTTTTTTSKVNATFLVLCRNLEVYSLLETIQSIEDRFNQKFHYDYTFLNDEPFTDEFIYLISTYIPQGKINFGIIPPEHWSYPDHINTTACSEIRANFADVPYGDSESYRHMCRFFSGFFYKQPMVRQYEYYWRIEPGIKLHCDVNQDVFRFMKENDKKYGFAISLFEYSETIPSLWSFVIDYISKQKSSRPELLPMLQNGFGWYNLCHFWSNFEIARVDVFDNYEYEQFFQYLDSKEGFYYERWGDAPIHTIGICLFLKKQDIHWFDNLGYYHPPYLQCPQDPESYINNKCTCDPDDDINSNENLSCTNHFLRILNS